jgi:hypothetical protein
MELVYVVFLKRRVSNSELLLSKKLTKLVSLLLKRSITVILKTFKKLLIIATEMELGAIESLLTFFQSLELSFEKGL